MDKTLFVIKIHSIIDAITNSSSELFVGKSQSKDEIVSLIKAVYPNYLDEYLDVKSTKELNNDELGMYVSFHFNAWSNSWQRNQTELIPGFTKEEMYDGEHMKDFITDKNRDRVIKGIDPNNEMYFLFSIEDNPTWDMQEKLEIFMTRYHLG